MKRKVTYVDQDKYLAIAREMGLKLEEQRGYIKITREGLLGRAVYVGNTKTVGRIDLSGFTHTAAVEHPKKPTPRVLQWMDLTRAEPEILRDFRAILEEGLAAPIVDPMPAKAAFA